jgi:DNA ligase-1
MTPFSKFAQLCDQLAAASKKLEKISQLADFLLRLEDGELRAAPLFILGKVFPDHDGRTLDVSWRTLQRVSANLGGDNSTNALSLLEVAEYFSKIAQIGGKGSRKKIDELLTEMLSRADDFERKCLFKIIFGEMRIGVAEGVLLESIAHAADAPLALVRRANMYLGDPGEVAFVALRNGLEGLAKINLQLFRPLQPMLAELAEDFSKVFKEHGGRTSLEFKFDGARVQIHKLGNRVRIYSRHLSDVTDSLPDVIETVCRGVRAESAIVEGEVVAVGRDGKPLPFQELMRRFRRVHGIHEIQKEVPVQLFLFDLLLHEGVPLVDSTYERRWSILSEICNSDLLVNRLITSDEREAEAFLQTALEQGHEGLMAKKLDSEYTPGSRGKRWFKIKPAETLDLVIIAAEWGSGRRVGWLSNYHLAARDETTGEFMMLGKTFKGLTDEQFRWMTNKLQQLKTHENSDTVFVKPQLVVEVAYNEIQRSPHYNSKFALRFARIKHIREDKTPAQADTMTRVRQLFEQQFARKARANDATKFK